MRDMDAITGKRIDIILFSVITTGLLLGKTLKDNYTFLSFSMARLVFICYGTRWPLHGHIQIWLLKSISLDVNSGNKLPRDLATETGWDYIQQETIYHL